MQERSRFLQMAVTTGLRAKSVAARTHSYSDIMTRRSLNLGNLRAFHFRHFINLRCQTDSPLMPVLIQGEGVSECGK